MINWDINDNGEAVVYLGRKLVLFTLSECKGISDAEIYDLILDQLQSDEEYYGKLIIDYLIYENSIK